VKRFLQLILAIAIGIALDQRTRRRAMFFLTIAALLLVFLGVTLLWPVFVNHPLFFAIYWLVCVWITICVMLVAIYDLLLVIRAGREAKRAARREMTGRKE
jgi:MFS-type transporter involved in bile tolerance (Atg22 family)